MKQHQSQEQLSYARSSDEAQHLAQPASFYSSAFPDWPAPITQHAEAANPFVERHIGTVRCEYLDQLFFWNAADLNQKLARFRDYFNEQRVHQGLAGMTPNQAACEPPSPPTNIQKHAWKSYCNGPFELPIAA